MHITAIFVPLWITHCDVLLHAYAVEVKLHNRKNIKHFWNTSHIVLGPESHGNRKRTRVMAIAKLILKCFKISLL